MSWLPSNIFLVHYVIRTQDSLFSRRSTFFNTPFCEVDYLALGRVVEVDGKVDEMEVENRSAKAR